MARSKLDQTTDFIELFEYAAGEWTTPPQFHRWAAISLIAACVEDRVWLPFSDHVDTFPNIWVFLIGPSGTGKDHAIRSALHLLRPEDNLWKIDGKATMPALYDYMHARQRASGRLSAPVYLVSSDVTEQLPLGPEAKDFTSRALSLYDRQDREMMDLTRTSGDKIVKRPMMNWVGGCTPEWFPLAIDPLVFASGYAGRAFFVFGEPNYDNFHLDRPTERYDGPLVRDFLRKKVEAYQSVEGMFATTERAKEGFEQWRRQQQDKLKNTRLSDVELSVINRMRASVKKLAMIFALSGWDGGLLVIKGSHMSKAISYTEGVFEGVKKVADFAYVNTDTQALNKVSEIIRAGGEIRRDVLLRYATNRGVKGAKVLDEIIDTLKQAGHITVTKRKPTKSGGRWPIYYVWKARKVQLGEMPTEEQDTPAPAEYDENN